MYGDFILIDAPGQSTRWRRLPIGQTGGRNEAWLRDTLLSNPEILPVREIDPAYGPLTPLCTELRTEAGPIDAAFINPEGKLTIVECKLWRNPQARREVVAQMLDYARALTRWSYSDLQRQVSARLNETGNVPFQRVQRLHPAIDEASFVDSTAQALRSGRFLMIIIGDGIREDVGAIAELINRNAASAFQLAIVEAALYDAGNGAVAVQPRVLAQTKNIERHVIIATSPQGQVDVIDSEARCADPSAAPTSERAAALRAWWEPVLTMQFDDPDQAAPVYYNNNVRAPLPWPRLLLCAYRTVKGDVTGVFLGGPHEARGAFFDALGSALADIQAEIPDLIVKADRANGTFEMGLHRSPGEFPNEAAQRDWIIENMNALANALRPRMKRLLPAM